MKRALLFTVSSWIGLVGFQTSTPAALLNGSFESPGLSGWSFENPYIRSFNQPLGRTAGSVGTMTSWDPQPASVGTWMPLAGDHFVALRTRANANFPGDGVYDFSISQDLQLNQGESLAGWAAFYNGDLVPQDSAWVRIYDQAGSQIATPWLEGFTLPNQSSVAALTATDWTHWEWEAPATGFYSIRLGMTTSGDNNGSSFGFFDNLTVQAANPVPEPSSLVLLMMAAFVIASRRPKAN